ncbi:glycoside hydrolase family 43 protein [Geofilum sp. OHC36d9]|uniref:glycoside hydrolase family 43 protein n=1 Tax=Geofilum sp. OHC36d9 TaxID=3458413 RepID=UPI0040345779
MIRKHLLNNIYIADPAVHVFDGKIYIYPSHDIETEVPEDDLGSHFDMKDYHVISMDDIDGKITDHGVALDIKQVKWAGRQMWDTDVAFKNGTYYLYFPVKDKTDIFRIGVAVSNRPQGPFKPLDAPIIGSYSIDPCVFKDDDGTHYMYFGGIWGGQLQRYRNNKAQECGELPADNEPALCAKVVKMRDDMIEFDEAPRDLIIVDEKGQPLLQGDATRRFFEASWMHKYKGKYYFSYSTGDTHLLCYAIGNNPYGPFTYQGVILNPVLGWTTHHSIVEVKGKWYLFFHDVEPSGVTPLRSIRYADLNYRPDGSIEPISVKYK